MLELHVSDTDVSSGSIGVSWCVSQDTIDFLSENNVKNPAIVLCTAPANSSFYNRKREFRKVVLLKDLIGYVEFKTKGENNIYGFIVEDEKVAKYRFLSENHNSYNSYDYSILDYEGSIKEDIHWLQANKSGNSFSDKDIIKYLLAEPVSVMVPEGAFAKEPSALEKAWVNHFFRRKVVDQCDFRRRRIFAYSIQLVLMFFILIWRFIQLSVSCLFLTRNLTLKYLIHPLTYDFESANQIIDGGSYCVKKDPHDDLNFIDKYKLFPLMPFLYIFYCSIYMLHNHGFPVYTILFATSGIVAFIFGAIFLAYHILDKQKEVEKNKEAWYLSNEEKQYIVCNPLGKKPTSFKDLPASKRTIKLRFQDMKSKVCKPFSA